MASKELEVLEDYIVQNKLKITRQRRTVLNAFLKCENHVSVEEIYNQVSIISLINQGRLEALRLI